MAVISAENAARASKYKLGSFEAFFFSLLPKCHLASRSSSSLLLRQTNTQTLALCHRCGAGRIDPRSSRRGSDYTLTKGGCAEGPASGGTRHALALHI